MFFKKYLIFFISIFFLFQKLEAQIVLPAEALKELESKNITEDELRARLLEQDVDLDKLKPADAPRVKGTIEAVIKELEAQKKEAKDTESDEVKTAEKPKKVTNLPPAADTVKQTVMVMVKNDSVKKVEIWGQQIFKNKYLKMFQNGEDVRPADNYVLGTGDKISVNIWGNARFSASQDISPDGYVQFDRLPRIFLKGTTYGKAKEIIFSRFSQYYPFSKDQFSVTLAYQRSVTVNIVGEVENSGSFTMSAQNTAFNALVASGGPSNIGSVRNIQLVRAGQKPRRLDVYEFIKNPSAENDFFLQSNDYISVPVAERVVSIQGAVQRPYKYELIKGENLMQLIDFAGGLQDSAYQSNIQIVRFVEDQERILDVNLRELKKNKGDFELLNGDRIVIKVIPKTYENFAEVTGAVDFPGRFEITKGLTVKDLIQKAVLKKEARRDVAYLVRIANDRTAHYERISLDSVLQNPSYRKNFEVKSEDRIIVYQLDRYTDRDTFVVSGAVRNPGVFPYDSEKNIRVSDALILAGGTRPSALEVGYIVRNTKENPLLKEYTRIDLKAIERNPNSEENKIIRPAEELRIFDRLDFADTTFVRVSGAVRRGGEFVYDKSLTLRDAITLAGGITFEGVSNRIDVFRVVMQENQPTRTVVATVQIERDVAISSEKNINLEPFDQIVVRSTPDFSLQKMVYLKGEVVFPGPYALLDKNEKIASVIARAGGLTAEAFAEGATLFRVQDSVGFVVMRLEQALRNKNDKHNFTLRANDEVTIPKSKDFVVIQGATRAPELYPNKILAANKGRITVAYAPGKDAYWYIQEYAAGVSDDGKRSLITVEDPSGQIKKTQNYYVFKSYPTVRKGSVITVGLKEEKRKIAVKKEKKEETDWAKLVSNAIAQATAVLSLILLVQNINK